MNREEQHVPEIATWLRADSSRPYCTRPWRQTAVLSDGTAVCACVDAEKRNPLGDLGRQGFDEVWNGPAYRALRRAIATDIDQVPICRGCPNRTAGPPPPPDFESGVPRPRILFIESHAACNLSCPGCNRAGIEGSRSSLSLPFATYARIIDALSPDLGYMEFHLGGENYMHRSANEMVRCCREKNPGCLILSSTNGHFFHTEERRQAVLNSGIDCLIFSVDGARQETYEKYRRGGRLERVLEAMRRLAAMKKEQGRERPWLIWRYILFEWNDSGEGMEEARRLARSLGVDHLAWHLTAVPGQAASLRYHAGSPRLAEIQDELWDTLPERAGMRINAELESYR
ncbi:MAG: SPASM domain-containing protein [Planctomycetes bacterium]|nr:SPASM domain-containing protein [Planctomycetota bacterium]